MRRIFIKGNSKSNGIVNRHLKETPTNSFACFEETVRGRKCTARWSLELEIKIEELYRIEIYEPIYELLLKANGTVEHWAKLFGNRYNIDWHELFSDFQLHLFNMLDGISDKAYNMEISFMNNLYRQLECLAKDKRRFQNRAKRKYDCNCIPNERLEQIPDTKNEYEDIELLTDLRNLDCPEDDRQILIGLATGQICNKDVPTVLNWINKDDRKKLRRYCHKLSKLIMYIIFITAIKEILTLLAIIL